MHSTKYIVPLIAPILTVGNKYNMSGELISVEQCWQLYIKRKKTLISK